MALLLAVGWIHPIFALFTDVSNRKPETAKILDTHVSNKFMGVQEFLSS